MSILDLGFDSKEEFLAGLTAATPVMADVLESTGLADDTRIKLLQEGYSAYEILDMTKDELNALFAHGYQFMAAGDVQKARDAFQMLCQLDPYDERFIYGLAATHQFEANYSTAAKLYLCFIALDATNPDGYLRLGECLMAARELDEAAEYFSSAKALCEKGHGDEQSKAHAETMLAQLNETKAAALN